MKKSVHYWNKLQERYLKLLTVASKSEERRLLAVLQSIMDRRIKIRI